MRYQIRDINQGIIVDQNLSYEEALVWIDTIYLHSNYIMEPMKEVDRK